MIILGISAFYHDAAACLMHNGKVVAAAQEERFSRIKNDPSFPKNAIDFCLRFSKIEAENIDFVVFYEKPFVKFERIVDTYIASAPLGFQVFKNSLPHWLNEKLFLKKKLRKLLSEFSNNSVDWNSRLLFSEHHLSHAASAFFPSPFQEAAILTIDGVGEWATTSISLGKGNRISRLSEIHFPHSIGLLYSAFTSYLGFEVNSGEYKMMGLAPYGKPIYSNLIEKNLIQSHQDGSFRLDMKYFNFTRGNTMTNRKFHNLFGKLPREPKSLINNFHMDLAASIQNVTEMLILKLAMVAARKTGSKNLCIAGGVGLNCVANGKLQKSGIFENLWIQPAAGDAGAALGAAACAYHMMLNKPRRAKPGKDKMNGAFLGPAYTQPEIEAELKSLGASFKTLDDVNLINTIAKGLASGKAIGWCQGRMEFGPRALGNRSILADPRSPTMQKTLNKKIKFRESFRPFGPSVLVEECTKWFELDIESPYMLFVSSVAKQQRTGTLPKEPSHHDFTALSAITSKIPAATHVDFSARIQTVSKNTNPKFHSLIQRFFEITGCPVVLNTSFNVNDEPIVMSPKHAYECFLSTNIDILVIGNSIIKR